MSCSSAAQLSRSTSSRPRWSSLAIICEYARTRSECPRVTRSWALSAATNPSRRSAASTGVSASSRLRGPLETLLELVRRARAQRRAEARRRLVGEHERELEQRRERQQAAGQRDRCRSARPSPPRSGRPTRRRACSVEPLGGPMIWLATCTKTTDAAIGAIRTKARSSAANPQVAAATSYVGSLVPSRRHRRPSSIGRTGAALETATEYTAPRLTLWRPVDARLPRSPLVPTSVERQPTPRCPRRPTGSSERTSDAA